MTPTNDFIVKMAEFDYIGQRLTGRLEITCYIGPDVFIYGTIKHVVVHERNLMNSSSSSTFLSFRNFRRTRAVHMSDVVDIYRHFLSSSLYI